MEIPESQVDGYTSVFVKEGADGKLTHVLVPTSFLDEADPDSLNGILTLLKSSCSEEDEPEEALVQDEEVPPEENFMQIFNLTHGADETGEKLTIEMKVNDPQCQEYLQYVGFKFELICQKCQHTAKTYGEMVSHLQQCVITEGDSARDDEIEPQTNAALDLRCEWCPGTHFHNAVDLHLHLQCHNDSSSGLMSCCFCLDRQLKSLHDTRNWALLKAHLHAKHAVDFQLECEECCLTFGSHNALKQHSASHSLPCPRCNFEAKHQGMLDVHELCHSPEDTEQFVCFVCSYLAAGNANKWPPMASHLEMEHPGLIPFPHCCQHCGKGFKSIKLHAEHVSMCAMQEDMLPFPTEHCCVCNGEVRVGSFASHFSECIQQHRGEIMRQFPSDDSNKSNLNLRQRVKVHKCVEHAAVFENEQLFLRHIVLSHMAAKATTEKQEEVTSDLDYTCDFKCPICYKKFQTENRLRKHTAKLHSADKQRPVNCPICKRSFKSANRLRNHTREVHEGKKRKAYPKSASQDDAIHMCEMCAYITPSIDRLKNHKKAVHDGVLPFKCTLCEYRTSERSDLARHKYKHKNGKRFRCAHCSYCTNERWVLVNHCLRQHGVHLPKKSRDTRGRPGSLRWQQALDRKRLQQQQQQQQETSLVAATHPTDGYIIQPMAMEGSSDQATFFVDTEAESASQVLLMKQEELVLTE